MKQQLVQNIFPIEMEMTFQTQVENPKPNKEHDLCAFCLKGDGCVPISSVDGDEFWICLACDDMQEWVRE